MDENGYIAQTTDFEAELMYELAAEDYQQAEEDWDEL